ncbi:MAG: c-type cytochrome [Azospirillum sp.]|nr:c-type cytochrome [Azospirillum sp.]
MDRAMTFAVAAMLASSVAVSADAGSAGDSGSGDPGRGEHLFKTCAVCHTVNAAGRNRTGPRLFGLFGREAGTVDGFKYSPALRDSRLVWTPETLSALLARGPDAVVPGSKMPLQLMPAPDDRADLIAFLRQATAAGQ